jgi:acyl-CoA synthetase (AMP-forming)/AMP-acid ligase II
MTERRTIAGHSIRWDQTRAEAAYAQGHWVRETLADALVREVAARPDRVLITEAGADLTAAEMHAKAITLAHALLARFPAGSVVSFMLPNWHEAGVIYLAATIAGMVAHPVLPSLRDHDLKFMLADVGSRMIFVPAQFRGIDYAAMLGRVAGELAQPPEIVVLRGPAGDHTPYEALFADVAPQPLPQVDADAVRMIMYTSGTTGRPKGVMHSHNSIHALIRQLGAHWDIDAGDKFLVASPISHIGGSIYVFEMPILLGTTAILMDKWDPDHGVQVAIQEKATHLAGATPFLEHLLAASQRAETNLPDLKVFICGGASVPPSLIRRAAGFFGKAAVTRVYGSTEVPVTTIGVLDRGDVDHAAETDGRAGIATIKLAEATAEICARGPQMLVGYVHAGDEAKVFDAEGFYRTGDQGVWIDGDYLVVSGRIKDIIIRNGENIAPKEVEDLLVGHPSVAEVAIVGIPDPKTGERACAVIVAKGDAQPTLAEIVAFLDAKGIAKFKFPEAIALWDVLPKNEAGKVLKHQIRADLVAATA